MKKHILLVDDDKDELDIFSEALVCTGIDHKCTWAQGVLHALSILEYIVPDAIFIDHNMPVINGMEGIGMIRKIEKLTDVPIVLYSSHITNEDRI